MVLATIESGLIEPDCMTRLLIDAPTCAPCRLALAVVNNPSFRALVQSRRGDKYTPFSTIVLTRHGKPSPSKTREPKPQGRVGSSTRVTSELATGVPIRSNR